MRDDRLDTIVTDIQGELKAQLETWTDLSLNGTHRPSGVIRLYIPDGDITFDEEFSHLVAEIEAIVKPYLIEFFGERCPEYDSDCEICSRWDAFDTLIEDI